MCFFFQAAVEASWRNCRYVIFHSGIDMIVCRLVPLPGSLNRYYLEASPRIPVDSPDYPHMAVIVAIIFDARVPAPAAPLRVANVPRSGSDPGRRLDPRTQGYPPLEDRAMTRAMRRSQAMDSILEHHDRHYHSLKRRSRSVRSIDIVVHFEIFHLTLVVLGSSSF
jgi:hypothetical protein